MLNCGNPSADTRPDSDSPDQTIPEIHRISETLSLRDHGHAVEVWRRAFCERPAPSRAKRESPSVPIEPMQTGFPRVVMPTDLHNAVIRQVPWQTFRNVCSTRSEHRCGAALQEERVTPRVDNSRMPRQAGGMHFPIRVNWVEPLVSRSCRHKTRVVRDTGPIGAGGMGEAYKARDTRLDGVSASVCRLRSVRRRPMNFLSAPSQFSYLALWHRHRVPRSS